MKNTSLSSNDKIETKRVNPMEEFFKNLSTSPDKSQSCYKIQNSFSKDYFQELKQL